MPSSIQRWSSSNGWSVITRNPICRVEVQGPLLVAHGNANEFDGLDHEPLLCEGELDIANLEYWRVASTHKAGSGYYGTGCHSLRRCNDRGGS